MNKKIFIILGNIVFLLFLIGGYFFWKLYSEQTPATVIIPAKEITNTEPKQANTIKTPEIPVQKPKEGEISITAKDGGNMIVNDFFKSKKTTIYEEWGASLKEHPYYSVLYFTIDQSFLISLTGGDLKIARTDAEKELLQDLGITEEKACQLKVATTIPSNVNEKAAGRDYGLSFCQNGTPLPKNL
ncbi:MAG: hypothetical protein NTZ13_01175 [Candidatus Parcubacteria bacterium]|nr:hypothetical protein [Candidatus Parcubacteria bacterium]